MELKRGSIFRWATRLYCRIFRPPGWVQVSGGFFIRVRKLDLYELDNVGFNDPGPFTYTYEIAGGKTKEAIYDISQWPEPPKAPGVPEEVCDPQSMERALWKVYNTYQSALLQRVRQVEAAETYAHDVAKYILANCIAPVDRELVETPGDYEIVFGQAVNPEVGIGDVAQALSTTFGASFDGQPVLDQIFKDKGDSGGKADAIRQWAGQARQAWGLKNEEWAKISLRERAEMIVITQLPQWFESLGFRKREQNIK